MPKPGQATTPEVDWKLAMEAERGRSGPEGWTYADTGDTLWCKWFVPGDPSSEDPDLQDGDFPLLRVEHEYPGLWGWEVLDEQYKRLERGYAGYALEGMRWAEEAAGNIHKQKGMDEDER